MAKKINIKKVAMDEPLIHKRVQVALAIFFVHRPPDRVNRNLRDILLHYLSSAPDGSHFNFRQAVDDLATLIRVLDKVEVHLVNRSIHDVIDICKNGNYYGEFDKKDPDEH